MKVMIDIFALCESAAELVGPSVEIFKNRRSRGNFTNTRKLNSIVDAIMAKPKKFLNLSMENLLVLSGFKKTELRKRIFLAVKDLGKPKYKTMIQAMVFETDDERILRGNYSK